MKYLLFITAFRSAKTLSLWLRWNNSVVQQCEQSSQSTSTKSETLRSKNLFTTLVILLVMTANAQTEKPTYFGIFADSFCYPSQSVQITPNYVKETVNNTVNLHYYKISNDTIYFNKTNDLGEKTTDFYPAYLLKMKDKAVSDDSGCDRYQWYLRSIANPRKERDYDFVLNTNQYNPEKPTTEVLQIKQLTNKLCFTREYNRAENKTIVVKHFDSGETGTETVELPKDYYIYENLNFIDELHFVSNMKVSTGYGVNNVSIQATNDGGKTWKKTNFKQMQRANFKVITDEFMPKKRIKNHKIFFIYNGKEGLMLAYTNNAGQDWKQTAIIAFTQNNDSYSLYEYNGSTISNYYFDDNDTIIVDMPLIINNKNQEKPITEKNIRFISKDGGTTFEKTKF